MHQLFHVLEDSFIPFNAIQEPQLRRGKRALVQNQKKLLILTVRETFQMKLQNLKISSFFLCSCSFMTT